MKAVVILLFVLVWLSFAAQPDAVLLDVPYVKQEKNGCGAAAISMVMQYWMAHHSGIAAEHADAERILEQLYSKEAEGIYGRDMQRYFEKHGFHAFPLNGSWEDLRKHLGKGRPVVAALKHSSDSPIHYVVAAGMEGDVIVFNDPADRKMRKQDRAGFEKSWRAADNWMLLAVPRQ